MHDRGPPREQKLMRPPVPQLPVSTRENLVKKFFRAAHKLPCGSSMQRECPQYAVKSEHPKIRRGHPLPRRTATIRGSQNA